MELHHKLDGIIILGPRFGFVKPLELKLKTLHGISVRRVNKSTFKGVSHATDGEVALTITFGESYSLSLAFLVNANRLSVNELNEQTIRTAYLDSANEAIASMVGSRTARLFNNEFPVLPDFVFARDITSFLNILTEVFETKCQLLVGDDESLNIRCLGFKMGMDIGWPKLKDLMYPFNLAKVEEAVIHYAQDFIRPNHMLVWNKEAAELFLNGKLTSKYMAGLLKEGWNYYISFTGTDHYDAENHILIEIKLYTELFKDVHKGNQVPFNGPHISKRLFSPTELMGNVGGPSASWTRELKNISMIIQYIQNISDLPHLAARMEAIIQVDCSFEDADSTLQLLCESKEYFIAHRGCENSEILKKVETIPLSTIHTYLENNLLPFAKTLNLMVRKHIRRKEEKRWSRITPGNNI